ncbi:MAG: EscJ/YscJ/HrcJ family type III secretion inner membrane ring protein, partial [Chlamydiia bacterium]|nr:EscJ/YscJ/HrcJ family type III secretion inner membrane ring protein [Chlamydiia bacterium]
AQKKAAADAQGGAAGGALYWDISVSEGDAIEAMAQLNNAGLPRRRGQNLLGIFQEGGLVPSEMQEKVRFQQGLAEQIANTIRKIDGIIDADVQLSFPEEDVFNPEANKDKKVTASVYVKHTGVMDDPNALLETKIKRLVASSINGLDFQNVTVIADRARYLGDTTLIGDNLTDKDKDYVSVWSIVMAKDSVGRFRFLFFSFVLIILACLVLAVWMLYKFLPVLSAVGYSELFKLAPISTAQLRAEAVAAAEGSGEEESEEEEEDDEDEDEDEEER